MNRPVGFTILLIVVSLVLCFSSFDVQAGEGTGKVLGIHHYSLTEGVEAAKFEEFIREDWLPTVNVVPGIHLMVMKGERGAKVGNYLLVFEIDSLYVRDYYFPRPGEQSEAARAAQGKCGERCEQVWNKLDSMVERSEYTDYVQLVGR